MVRLPIGLQLFSVRDDMEKDFAGTLKKVKEMGYDGVEFAGLYGKTPAEVKKLCDEIGLIPVSAHVPFAEMIAAPDSVIEAYRILGVQQIVIPYLTEEYRPGAEGFDTLIAWAQKLGSLCKASGMKLAYHNHDFEFTKMGEDYALDILYREVPSDYLETQLDTCWVFVGGEDPIKYVKKYAHRQYTVHLKDFWVRPDFVKGQKCEQLYQLIGLDAGAQAPEEEGQNFCFRPVGYGVQNVAAIIQTAEESGAKWIIVEQDNPSMGKTPLECARMSVQYLKQV